MLRLSQPKDIIENQNNKLHVAAYCRVSTFDDSQSGSFELQKQSYLEKINANPNWILAGIYADQGTSGTSTRKRTQFMKMIEDCRQGKIDLILVKSVSRFARNQLDFIGTSRELKSLPHPVGIYIEDINLNTLDTNSEFILGILAIVAQGESEQKSAAITWSIIERFRRDCQLSTHNLLGYTKDKFGRVIIDKSESKVVKFIYDSYINGTSVTEIANQLMKRKISTLTGLERWSNSSIYRILEMKNIRRVVMQKTFTVDCFSHKSRKNNGEKTQYILEHGIPSIISDKKWELTQKLLKYPNCKSKSTKVISMPRLYIRE